MFVLNPSTTQIVVLPSLVHENSSTLHISTPKLWSISPPFLALGSTSTYQKKNVNEGRNCNYILYICFYSYLASCMLLPLFGVLQIYCTLSAFPYNTHAHCVCAPYIYTLCPHSLTYGPTPISVVSLYPFLEGSRLCDR